MPLIRIKPGDLPTGVPLPWPVFGKNGAMLLNAGGIVPVENASALLNAGLYRSLDETERPHRGRDLTARGTGGKPGLPGLTTLVESVQIGLLEEGGKQRSLFRVEFFGRLPDASLIVGQPRREGRLLPICAGQNVTVKMFVSPFIHAFTAQVLCAPKLPAPYMHLSHPEAFRSSVLRTSKRVDLRLSILALLRMGEEFSIPVSVVDLSDNGLALLSEYPLGSPGASVDLSFSVTVAGQQRMIQTRGIVRNGRQINTQRAYRYGVELAELTPEQKIAIQAFVYQLL